MEILVSIIMIVLLIVSIIATIYLKFPQFEAFNKIRYFNKHSEKNNAKDAFLVTLATNIGTGNLVGVTSGIILGGPGIIIWMWIFGFFSSSLAFLENYYAVKYQEKFGDEYRGGACFYILKGLNAPAVSIIFALFLLLTNSIFFPSLQANTIVEAFVDNLHWNRFLVGALLLIVLSYIVFRGTRSITKAVNIIVPPMTIGFVVLTVVLVVVNYKTLPTAIYQIIDGAFNIKSMGIAAIINCISVGIRRSLFSHEAGLGTTPSISAMSNSQNCEEQAYYQMLGVYVDTLLMCTLTGILVVQMNLNYDLYHGGDVISAVFSNNLGKIGSIISFCFLFVFAFASLIGQYYLGESNALFLTKVTKIKPIVIRKVYRLFFITSIIIGTIFSTFTTMKLVDFALIALGLINVIALYKLVKTGSPIKQKK